MQQTNQRVETDRNVYYPLELTRTQRKEAVELFLPKKRHQVVQTNTIEIAIFDNHIHILYDIKTKTDIQR